MQTQNNVYINPTILRKFEQNDVISLNTPTRSRFKIIAMHFKPVLT